jgi:hypothetical protein
MIDVGIRDRNDIITRDPGDDRPVDRRTESPPKPRPAVQRRWGGRRFALGGFLLLAAGVALGAWHHYSQHQEVMAAAERERDFVPSVRVATVEANPGIVSVTLPGTTAAFADANIYARATGYIAKRNVDIGDRVKQGELLAQLRWPAGRGVQRWQVRDPQGESDPRSRHASGSGRRSQARRSGHPQTADQSCGGQQGAGCAMKRQITIL